MTPPHDAAPLTPEAVAQMVADLTHTDGPDGEMSMLYRGVIADALTTLARKLDCAEKTGETYRLANAANLERATTLAAENATLRAERDGTRETLRMIKAWDFPGDIQDLSVQIEALRASEAAAMERVKVLETALKFYRGAWSFKTNKRYGGLEWFPSEKLLDDCGNVAKSALTPTADRTEYERKVAQMKEDFPNGI